MALNDFAIRKANPRESAYKMADGGGLSLFVSPSGSKTFQQQYRYRGKAKTLTFGPYPIISLADAREKRDAVKRLLAEGRDPRADAEEKAAADKARLFSTVAEEWWERKRQGLVASYEMRVRTRVFDYLVPQFKGRSVDEITARDVVNAIRHVEDAHGIAAARRVHGFCRDIFGEAIVTRGLPFNPASGIEKQLSKEPKPKTRPHLEIGQLPQFFIDLRAYERAREITIIALELYMHTLLRNTELRTGRWEQIKGDEWHIPEGQMKIVDGESLPHIVPLSRQSRALLKRLERISGDGELMFPKQAGNRGKPGGTMSENATGDVYDELGYRGRACNHGWRHTFSTLANESGLWNEDWIEKQLAHHPRNRVRAVYNRAQYLKQRHEMMQWWSDQLSEQERIGMKRAALEDDLSDILG